MPVPATSPPSSPGHRHSTTHPNPPGEGDVTADNGTGEATGDASGGSADICPAVLRGVYQCPKFEVGVVQNSKVGWTCYWRGKWFSGRHPMRALNHVLKVKMRKGIAPCPAITNAESTKRYVCCCVLYYWSP